jgi:hypothetical protein
VLFICKKNESYAAFGKRSGLFNSVNFVRRALVSAWNTALIDAWLEEVTDNNDIDRVVTKHKPDMVIIEALWVVPEKFDVLKRLHPSVRWYVHLHSNAPFLALEGIAMDWLLAYQIKHVGVIVNSKPAFEALEPILNEDTLYLLHNVYKHEERLQFPEPKRRVHSENEVHVGCMGAVRPMKNQLTQALAAIKYAEKYDKTLYFYINSTRSETGGDPVIKNIRALFGGVSGINLVEQKWQEHKDFVDFLGTLDISMQVSLSETFNIVTADAVSAGTPVVVSNEIEWISGFCKARTDSVDDIVSKMERVMGNPLLVWWNRYKLDKYSAKATKEWLHFVTGE